jgi:hypothetical protein
MGELEKATLLEEISWRQKSRVTNSNRRNNSSESLSINGSVSSNQPTIRDHIVQFYLMVCNCLC